MWLTFCEFRSFLFTFGLETGMLRVNLTINMLATQQLGLTIIKTYLYMYVNVYMRYTWNLEAQPVAFV